MNDLQIRIATKNDCKNILAIYEYYVLNTSITFEYEVPLLEEIEKRMETVQTKYPYLVAEMDGKIVGYAYATDFRFRAAYQWSSECAIYIHKDFQGKGIGKKLYQKLFAILRLQGYYNVFSGVVIPNEASVNLHLACGFREIGVYENIGYKFEKWHTTKWFQLALNEYQINPEAPKKTNEIELNFNA